MTSPFSFSFLSNDNGDSQQATLASAFTARKTVQVKAGNKALHHFLGFLVWN
jgi:hypothetical protein